MKVTVIRESRAVDVARNAAAVHQAEGEAERGTQPGSIHAA